MNLEAEQVIEFLRALEPAVTEPLSRISQVQGEQIAAFIRDRGGYSLFVDLDERPGRFDYAYASDDWHWKLRQARNGCREFFNILNGEAL
jgi:hypothetical protein